METKLEHRFRKCIEAEGLKIYTIADAIGLKPQKLYNFSSQNGKLCNDEAVRLHNFLKERGY